jgi:O-antigen/teichoic acid export membrane protein
MGIQTELYSWAAFLLIPFTYRMETAMFRFGSKKEELMPAFRTAAISILLSTILITVILISTSYFIAGILEYSSLQHFIILIIIIVAVDALLTIPFALLRLEEKALKFAFLKTMNMVLYLGLVFFFVSICPGLYKQNYLFAQSWYHPEISIGYVFIANLIANGITLIFLLPSYLLLLKKNKEEPFFNFQLWKKMLGYASPLILVGFAGVINEVLDRSLLKYLLSGDLNQRLSELGIYGACYKIAIFMNLLTQAFNYASEPFFFKHASKDGSRQLYADVALVFTIIGSFVFLGIMAFMDLFQYFVAAPYREGLHIVPILLLANLFLGLYYNVGTWYKLADKTIMGAYISVAGATITILGNILLIPVLGIAGAAWTTLLCYFSMFLISYLSGQKYYAVPYSIWKIISYILTSLICYFVFWMIKNYFQLNFGITLLLSFGICFIFILITLKLDSKNIRQILRR